MRYAGDPLVLYFFLVESQVDEGILSLPARAQQPPFRQGP